MKELIEIELEIVLVRHGETDWNREQLFRGRANVELNANGREQAALLAERLKGLEITAVYSSPLRRALETARIIAAPHSLEVGVAEGLIDIDYGRWQGLPRQQVIEEYPELYRRWQEEPHRVRFPEGEGLEDVRERALAELKKILRAYPQGRVILVAHRVVNKILICAMLELDNSHFWRVRQDTCAFTTFEYRDGEFILTGHNDAHHLNQVGKERLRVDF